MTSGMNPYPVIPKKIVIADKKSGNGQLTNRQKCLLARCLLMYHDTPPFSFFLQDTSRAYKNTAGLRQYQSDSGTHPTLKKDLPLCHA